jgi:hypothetical protein
MKKNKRNKIIGLIVTCINALLVLDSLYWYCAYNFTDILYLVMIPYKVLLVKFLLGILGFYISILLYKGKIGIKLFLIATLAIWLIIFANYVFSIMY